MSVDSKERNDNIKIIFFYCCFHFHLCSASKDPIEQRKAINSGRKFLSKAALGIFAFLANACKRFGNSNKNLSSVSKLGMGSGKT